MNLEAMISKSQFFNSVEKFVTSTLDSLTTTMIDFIDAYLTVHRQG